MKLLLLVFIGGVFVGIAFAFMGLCAVAILGGAKEDEPCRMPQPSQEAFEPQLNTKT